MAKKTETEGVSKLIESLNKDFGSGTIIGGREVNERVETVKTGSLTLDMATAIGGNPVGRLIEMFGPESSGKSTLTLHFIAEFQKAGKKCVLIDGEQSFDRIYASNLGVDCENLLYVQPDYQEQAYNIALRLIESKEIGLIVIDSHTSLMPKKVVDGDVGEATIGLQARVNSTALGKMHPLLRKNGCTIVGISQTRMNIGGYGDPNVSTGGMAWKFYSDMRYKVSKILEKDGAQNKTTVEVIKNKCGVPFGKASFNIVWGQGIDRLQEIIDLSVEHKILAKGGGGWYTVEGDQKIQGDDKLKEFLNDNPEYQAKLEEEVLKTINL